MSKPKERKIRPETPWPPAPPKATKPKPDPLVEKYAAIIYDHIAEPSRMEGLLAFLVADAREEGRAEVATVPCGLCGDLDLGPEDYPCPAPGCVNGRVDARLAVREAALEVLRALAWTEENGDAPGYEYVRKNLIDKKWPEAEEAT